MKFIDLTNQPEEIRRKVQDKLYEMGYSWAGSPKYSYLNKDFLVWEYHEDYLYDNDDYDICSSTKSVKGDKNMTEVSLTELLGENKMTGLKMLMAGKKICGLTWTGHHYLVIENDNTFLYNTKTHNKTLSTITLNALQSKNWIEYSPPVILLKDADKSKIWVNTKYPTIKYAFVDAFNYWVADDMGSTYRVTNLNKEVREWDTK